MCLFADADKDYVSVSSDEELLEALTATTVQPLKLYIETKGPGLGPQSQAAGSIILFTQSLAFVRMQIQKIVELKSALW